MKIISIAILLTGFLMLFPNLFLHGAIMQIKGLELGDCRLPLEPLSANDALAFKAELTEIGFLTL